jgi:hypothetical protein
MVLIMVIVLVVTCVLRLLEYVYLSKHILFSGVAIYHPQCHIVVVYLSSVAARGCVAPTINVPDLLDG